MPSAAIVLDAIEKSFPPALSGMRAFLQPFEKATVPALAGISFKVEAGEAVGLLGANGTGKSTLLRILSTLLLPSKGSAAIAGHDVLRDSRGARRSLGYHAGSDLGFYARLSGRDNLLFFGQLNHLKHDEASRRIAELSERFNLGEALERQVRTLSSGTIQRLSLARALLHQPQVLLLDEPTRSLDPVAAADFRQFLKREILRSGDRTLLFASHSLQEFELLANRVAVIDRGKLIAFDTPRALKRQTAADSLEDAFFSLTGHKPHSLEPSS